MRAWELAGFGRANLRMVDKPVPSPGETEVLVRVGAASLNARDRLIAQGVYNPDLSLPIVQGSDAVGTVERVGDRVTRVRPGDRVLTNFATRWLDGPPRLEESRYTLGNLIPGVLAEQIVIDESIAVRAPAYLTDVEAATLPCAAVTAWHALVDGAGLAAGQSVLVQGTGGVSIFALQVATAIGARVIVTSSSDDKIARAKVLGATDGINYVRRPDWERAALDLTGGHGVDVVVEVVGGENLARSLAAAKIGGHVALLGFLGGTSAEVPLFPFAVKQLTVRANSVGPRSAFEAMNRAFETWRLRPVVDAVYGFADTLAAYEHLYRGPFGKVVVSLDR